MEIGQNIPFLQRNTKPLFYAAWLLVALLHAGNSGLFDDEAYYWMYARHPDWGYFDHPPMIGFLIGAGYQLFHNEFGLRLFIVLISTGTLWAIDSLLEKRDDRLFYAISLSMGLMQIGGIIAVPDIPLMFFVVLFFLAYRRFLARQGALEIILVALTIAGMLYSKYHGILIVFFSLISNIRLLTKWQTYAVGLLALALFSPHLFWQFQHDYPSFRYHLFERNASYYKADYTFEYVFGQILMAGPLIGWLLLWAAAKKKVETDLEKALKYCLLGIYPFFLLSTFKGRVEANWTAPAYISLIVLSHQYLTATPIVARWVYRLFIPSFLIVLVARVYMMIDIDPLPFFPKDEFHRNKEWSTIVHEKAAGKSVVFVNTYQRPSQYNFYSGDSAFGLNNIFYRRNNYNFWPLEQALMGKSALVISHENYDYFTDTIHTPRGFIGSRIIDPFFSFSRVDIRSSSSLEVSEGMLHAAIEVNIPVELTTHLSYHRFDTAQIVMSIFKRDKKKAILIQTGARLKDVREGNLKVDCKLPASFAAGEYQIKWGINTAIPGWPSLNSSGYELVIRD
jgi:hypothetical protein